jgi:hypothetical protein
LYEAAIARGYSVAQVSVRGTGASQGCGDFGGPDEQGDIAIALDWAAARPWSTGRVGLLGHSYDGYAGIIAMSRRPNALAAAVLMAPVTDPYRGAFMNGVEYVQGPVATSYYQTFALVPPLTGAPEGTVGAMAGRDPSCAAPLVAEGQNRDAGSPFWRERDFTGRAAGADLPVLWTHGFLDGRDDYSAVRPNSFLDVWQRLTGPRRAWFGQFPHLIPGEPNTWGEPEPVGRDGFVAEALDWFDAYVKDDPGAKSRARTAPPVVVQDGAEGAWRAEPEWPPPSARLRTMPLVPGTYTDGPGNKAEQGDDAGGGCTSLQARCNPASRTGQGTWTFSQPVGEDVRVAGVARLAASFRAPTGARVVAIVYDVDRANRAALLTRGASLIGADGRAEFDLYPQDWRLEQGHRVGVLLSGSDDIYFEPGSTGARADVEGGSLALPVIADPRDGPVQGGPSRAVAERTTFPVDPATVGSSLSVLRLPERARPRLALRVRPRRVAARRRVRLRIVVRDSTGRTVPRALIRVGTRLIRSDRRGAAGITLRFHVPGRRALRVTRYGYRRGQASLRVVRP